MRTEEVTIASHLLTFKVLRQIVVVTTAIVIVVVAYIRIRGASIVIRAAVYLVIFLSIIGVVVVCGSIFEATATGTFAFTLLPFLALQKCT